VKSADQVSFKFPQQIRRFFRESIAKKFSNAIFGIGDVFPSNLNPVPV
jgi:hypothetical protein